MTGQANLPCMRIQQKYQNVDLLECMNLIKAITANWNWAAWKLSVQHYGEFVKEGLDGGLCLQHFVVNFIVLCQCWTRKTAICPLCRFTKSIGFCWPRTLSYKRFGVHLSNHKRCFLSALSHSQNTQWWSTNISGCLRFQASDGMRVTFRL